LFGAFDLKAASVEVANLLGDDAYLIEDDE